MFSKSLVHLPGSSFQILYKITNKLSYKRKWAESFENEWWIDRGTSKRSKRNYWCCRCLKMGDRAWKCVKRLGNGCRGKSRDEGLKNAWKRLYNECEVLKGVVRLENICFGSKRDQKWMSEVENGGFCGFLSWFQWNWLCHWAT